MVVETELVEKTHFEILIIGGRDEFGVGLKHVVDVKNWVLQIGTGEEGGL